MKTLGSLFRSSLTLGVVAGGLMLTPGTAHADYVDFTVDEGAVSGATPGTLTVDDITGKYQEALVPSGTSFTATLVVEFASYDLGGPLVQSQLGAYDPGELDEGGDGVVGGGDDTDLANLYRMYALVTVSGSFSQALLDDMGTPADTTDDLTALIFKPSSSTATIYVDPLRDTTTDYTTATRTGSFGDDSAVLTASLIQPYPQSNGSLTLLGGVPLSGGNYVLNYTNPTLVGIGASYWPSLSGLTITLATASGDIDPGSSYPGDIRGDTSIQVQTAAPVPEPASLVLLGTGLMAAGASRRRKKQQ